MGRFEEEFERTVRVGRSLSCLMVDIDHFKRINDKYGHLNGDVILKKVATCIMESLRPYDILFRFGGEEFMLVLPETELSNAFKIGERIRLLVMERTAGEIAVTVSIGVTGSREGESDLNDVINRADEALYHAKNEGRNRVEMRS
jgi:diguanylate cyclase (GGDEF)-like protein